ncbi:MAG: cation transporter [Magnetococcales bacterium]|nr:cation transporter [Magnetococcales bacterium]
MKFEQCQQCVVQGGWADLWGTLAQAVFRGLLGWMSGSMALVVQGLYSIGDALTKGVTLISVQIANRPPSKMFPFGFGKILFISSLTIGVGLLFGGASLALTSFTDLAGVQSVPSLFTVLGVFLSAAASELMHRYLGCIAKENNNMAMKSAAWDNRLDAISSVVVFVGIVLSNVGVNAADHIAAFVVALMVMRIGGLIAWDAFKGLLDVTVPQEGLADIARTTRMTQGVQDVRLIRGRSLGECWEIYLHVALDETLSIHAGHEIVESLKKRILEKFSVVQNVWVITVPKKANDNNGGDYWSDHLFSIHRDKIVEGLPPREGDVGNGR